MQFGSDPEVLMSNKPEKNSLVQAISRVIEVIFLGENSRRNKKKELLLVEQFSFKNKHKADIQLLRIIDQAEEEIIK